MWVYVEVIISSVCVCVFKWPEESLTCVQALWKMVNYSGSAASKCYNPLEM